MTPRDMQEIDHCKAIIKRETDINDRHTRPHIVHYSERINRFMDLIEEEHQEQRQ